MTTARDIITLAFKEAGPLGVGQTLLAEDINDGLTYLIMMLAEWQVDRWLIPSLKQVSALGNDLISNTIGPGGHFDVTPRPRQIKAGYFVQQNTGQSPVSLPLRPLMSYEDYIKITLKELNTYPCVFFYDNDWTAGVDGGLGNVFIWPIPNATYRIYLLVQNNLNFPNNDGLDDVFVLPPEYQSAIHYNLALRLCSGYQIEPQAQTLRLAKATLNVLRKANTQVPAMTMPISLQQTNRGFNIFNPDGY